MNANFIIIRYILNLIYSYIFILFIIKLFADCFTILSFLTIFQYFRFIIIDHSEYTVIIFRLRLCKCKFIIVYNHFYVILKFSSTTATYAISNTRTAPHSRLSWISRDYTNLRFLRVAASFSGYYFFYCFYIHSDWFSFNLHIKIVFFIIWLFTL